MKFRIKLIVDSAGYEYWHPQFKEGWWFGWQGYLDRDYARALGREVDIWFKTKAECIEFLDKKFREHVTNNVIKETS